jgi:hypothetical protein
MRTAPILDAMRGRSWFEREMLMPGERLVRRTTARMASALPPHRWHGELVLTNRRLFFLPEIDHPLLEHAAFWLHDVGGARSVRTWIIATVPGRNLAFELSGVLPVEHARSFAASASTLARIARARRVARLRYRRAG